MNDKKNPAAREAACAVLSAIADNEATPYFEPYVISSGETPLFSTLLETFADKVPAVATAATSAAKSFVKTMNPWAVATVLPPLLNQIKTAGKWQVKTGSLELINTLVKAHPEQMGKSMPVLVPVLADAVWDTKSDVKKAAKSTLTKATALVSNKDVSFLPAYIRT